MNRIQYGNGVIFTGEDEQTFATAMIVEDGRIRWVGATEALSGPYTDLGGRTVIPGFIDTHMHPLILSELRSSIPCMPPEIRSIRAMTEALKAAGEAAPEAAWIEGWGYDESKLAEGRAPNRQDLDRVSLSRPVRVLRSDLHSCSVNSRALALAGITEETPDPPGGIICRDPQGTPTGVLVESAAALVRAVMPQDSAEERAASVTALTQRFSPLGLTGVVEIMAHATEDLPCLAQALQNGFRQRLAVYCTWPSVKASGVDLPPFHRQRSALQINGLKLFLDGSISGHTAYMETPYPGTEDRGFPVGSREDLLEAYAYARTRNLQLAVHAMGDAAIRLVVDVFKDQAPWVTDGPSVRIEHASVLNPDLLADIQAAGIGLTQQIIFLYSEYDSYRQHLDDDRLSRTYGVRSAYEATERFALSSDSPATLWSVAEDVFVSIQAAVTRRAAEGQPINPAEAVTVPQAVLLYTRRAALLSRFTDCGSLTPGNCADFLVLDRDIFAIPPETLSQTRVLMTVIGGEVVYQA